MTRPQSVCPIDITRFRREGAALGHHAPARIELLYRNPQGGFAVAGYDSGGDWSRSALE